MIREFTIGCSKTVNLGNYNSIKVEASLTIAVGEMEDYATTRALAQDQLKSLLEETYRAQRKGDE